MPLLPYTVARPLLFGLDAENAHDLTLGALARLQHTPARCLWQAPRIADAMQLAGLSFPNRVGLAAEIGRASCRERV